ncbi:hypothetical protein ACWCXH_34010 [Kitasatospora sp. NPDC001660]
MALGLLASVAVLFYVGSKDAFEALTYGGRVMGVTFMTAALVEAISTVAVFDYWGKRIITYSGAAVLVGVGAVMATDFMFLIVQIEGGDYTLYLWLWIGLALWTVWALWTLSRQAVWQGIPHPKSLALGVAVSGLIGAVSLAYSQLYIPYVMPVTIPFTVSSGTPTLNNERTILHVPTHLEFRNSGSVRIYVVGTMWKVNGLPTKFTENASGMNDWKKDFGRGDNTFRHEAFSPSHMLGAGTFVSAGSRLDPGDDLSTDITVEVPLDSDISRVSVTSTVSYIRADRCKLGNSYSDSFEVSWDPETQDQKHMRDAPGWVADSGDEFFRYHSKIYHSSEMLNLARASDYATAWWVLPKWHEGRDFAEGDTDPYMMVSISRGPEGEEALSESQQEPYGMKTMTQSTDRTIAQLLQAAEKINSR